MKTIEQLEEKTNRLEAKYRAIPMGDYRRYCQAKSRWAKAATELNEAKNLANPEWVSKWGGIKS